ncbi:MAG: hypothetical protein WC155_11380, partial [Candidatus Cloacimonadales bacterium]
MKKKVLLFMLSILIVSTAFAQFVEIGDNSSTNSTNYAPLTGLWDYSWSSMIIPASFIGQAMEITSISYDVTNTPTNYEMLDQKVYIRHTEATSAVINYPEPIYNNFTLVYDDAVIWNGGGWQEIVLENSFEYDGTSNLEILWENHDGAYVHNYPTFKKTVADFSIVSYKRADSEFPATSGATTYDYPNMRLGFFAEGFPVVATLTAPENEASNVAIDVDLVWVNGENTHNVDVYLSSVRSEVFANDGLAKVVDAQDVTTFTTDLENGTTYFWKVVARNDAGLTISTNIYSFRTVYGENTVVTGVGSANTPKIPYNPYYKYGYSQSIYLPSEVFLTGDIETIAYDFNGNAAFDDEIVVYMGMTDLDEFATTSSWILESELTEVFDGILSTTTTAGWVNINLDTPFAYDGSANLVIAVKKNTGLYNSNNDNFYSYSVDNDRSLRHQHDTISADPAEPPVGALQAYLPNTMLVFADGEVAPDPLAPVTDLAATVNGSSATLTWTAPNAGTNTL